MAMEPAGRQGRREGGRQPSSDHMPVRNNRVCHHMHARAAYARPVSRTLSRVLRLILLLLTTTDLQAATLDLLPAVKAAEQQKT
jgi:hypothetical protein